MDEGRNEPGPEVVAGLRAGDEEAARQFFRQLHPFVLKIVRNHRPAHQSEEDLCQMIFLKAFSKIHQYSGPMPVSHWVSRIAVNTCITELQRARSRKELREADLGDEDRDLLAKVADPAAGDETALLAARELVARLLDRLAPADRVVISLLHLDGYSVAETSALTGFSRAVVKIRAFRARRKLHQAARILLGGSQP